MVVISRQMLSVLSTSLSMVVMKRISGLITTIERLEACAGLEELVITTTFRPERDRWQGHLVEPVGRPS